ncbi:hypothetical protein F5878DRAFT_680759 [Lentinula raphanica]|uniref:Uncharacterized protein n=1 Tax=Lentinula raphanica TaxID=153919 RepID=A0AA38PA33_9AGAR|nr:hypothetical protein F5878DRAFT_680759 [Lentinula raphanica]
MSAKQLSSGTLGLRFMQNAQRAKQLKEVELEKAHVEDDGRWEIAKEIRESWGPGGSDDAVSHESSYLPFLFPSVSTTPGPSRSADVPKGRRLFKRGREVKVSTFSYSLFQATVDQPPPPSPSSVETESVVPSADLSSKPTTRKPKSSSGITSSSRTTTLKSAKLAIFDTSQVGTDLRLPTKSHLVSAVQIPASPAFLKPAGVDEPKGSAHPASVDGEIITAAREVKIKRERQISSTQPDREAEGPTRKKKKKSTV